MHIRSLVIASIAIAAMTSSAFATNLARCEDLDPLVTENPPIVSYKTTSSNPNFHTSGSPKCGAFVPASAGACPDVGPGGSLSTPVSPAVILKVVTPVPDTVTPQFREGELDVKESAKASLQATKDAPQNQGKPFWQWTPVVVEVVDWDAAQEGSCGA